MGIETETANDDCRSKSTTDNSVDDDCSDSQSDDNFAELSGGDMSGGNMSGGESFVGGTELASPQLGSIATSFVEAVGVTDSVARLAVNDNEIEIVDSNNTGELIHG